REKSPAAISAARIFRPVGLMRSPIMTKGRSKPMTTSRVAELMTVSVMERSCWDLDGLRVVLDLEALRADQTLEVLIGVTCLDFCSLRGHFCLQVFATG